MCKILDIDVKTEEQNCYEMPKELWRKSDLFAENLKQTEESLASGDFGLKFLFKNP